MPEITTPAGHPFSFDQIYEAFVQTYGETVHTKGAFSIAGAVSGVLTAGALTVKLIGEALAQARGLADKNAVKQVDRLLSNSCFGVDAFARQWAAVTGSEQEDLWINLDWTDFQGDDQTMLVASMQTGPGRSMPLFWRTVTKRRLKGQMHKTINDVLDHLRSAIPAGRRV